MDMSLALPIAGATLAIVSALLSGVTIYRMDKKILAVEVQIEDVDYKIQFGKQYEAMGRSKNEFGQLLLAVLQSTSPPREVGDGWLAVAVKSLLGGLLDRNSAATGGSPPDAEFEEWSRIAERMKHGDHEAFKELESLSGARFKGWEERNNQLVKQKPGFARKKEALKAKTEQVRYASIALQLVGLILVLLKDVAAN